MAAIESVVSEKDITVRVQIGMVGLECLEKMKVDNIMTQGDHFVFPLVCGKADFRIWCRTRPKCVISSPMRMRTRLPSRVISAESSEPSCVHTNGGRCLGQGGDRRIRLSTPSELHRSPLGLLWGSCFSDVSELTPWSPCGLKSW